VFYFKLRGFDEILMFCKNSHSSLLALNFRTMLYYFLDSFCDDEDLSKVSNNIIVDDIKMK